MADKTVYSLEQILAILPHREPFLFVDRVVDFKIDKTIATERLIRPEEPQFIGHFPGKPIMPGVLVTDGLAQTAGLLWGFSKQERKRLETGIVADEPPELFYLAAANVKFVNPCGPGDVLRMTAWADKNFGSLYTYDVEAVAGRSVICKGSLTLAMMKGSL